MQQASACGHWSAAARSHPGKATWYAAYHLQRQRQLKGVQRITCSWGTMQQGWAKVPGSGMIKRKTRDMHGRRLNEPSSMLLFQARPNAGMTQGKAHV